LTLKQHELDTEGWIVCFRIGMYNSRVYGEWGGAIKAKWE